jgi:hypothetical protein
MTRRWLWPAGGALLAAGLAWAAPPAGPALFKPARDPLEAAALAARIDARLADAWAAAKITPAAEADDAEFLRRVYLDLAGRVPTVSEARRFLAGKGANKRTDEIDKLLNGPRYVVHFTDVWRSLLLPESNANLQGRFLAPGMEQWLRRRLAENVSYDQMVREVLTAPYGGGGPFGGQNSEPSPAAFYFAKDFKPENLAAGTARLFLGVKIECAQCHNHPFGDWKREQFWSYAALFAGVRGQTQGDFVNPAPEEAGKHELAIPGTDKVAKAAFLDGKQPDWSAKGNGREQLADWLTAPNNPYFARAAVNRLWFHFFGAGLTDPVDEMVGGQGVAAHPELLDELAGQFIAHKYDLKYLIKAIVLSKAYQRSSVKSVDAPDEPQRFARMPLRGLTPEQLYDSVAAATYHKEGADGNPYAGFAINGGSPRAEFIGKFANQSERPTEATTSILQALTLMNGKLIGDETSLERSDLLTGVLEAPFMDTKERIETLYLATLTRKPRAKELDRALKYVEAGGADASDPTPASEAEREKRYKKAMADVFWALLNSGEFYLNH